MHQILEVQLWCIAVHSHSTVLTIVLMVLFQLTGTEDRKKEATWYDVGIIKGTSCTVSSYYLPSGELEKSEIDLEVRLSTDDDDVHLNNPLCPPGRGVYLQEAGAGARDCLQVPCGRYQRLWSWELVRDLRLQNMFTR